MNTPLNISEFIKLAEGLPVIDVRSPAEFEHGHIPGAHTVPLFDNEERAKIGTAYKQIGREEAIRIGYELANPKINFFRNQIEKIVHNKPSNNRIPIAIGKHLNNEPKTGNQKQETVLIHCWRGGLRSTKFAALLNEYGYKTHTLLRGYKAYRNFVLKSFGPDSNQEAPVFIIGGETGSGKTEILRKIAERGEQIIDLEAIAHHKGSAFGSLGEKPQPTQEQFENDLASHWNRLDFSKRIWLEDEAQSIGKKLLPKELWNKMKQAPILRLKVSKSDRIGRLVTDYGKFSSQELAACIEKIQQRLGGQHVKRALEELQKGNLHEVVDIALTYYDKAYNYDHEKRNMKDVFLIECETADASANADKLIEFANTSLQTAKNEAGSNLTAI
ncbi:MAG: tRNA 2-selenouridine(34) synthase MnmH [Bacteroidia bacterium]